MENNNGQGFSMDEYNKFLKQIKAGSPVHKINFTLENPNAIVGMYLLTMEDVEPYLDKVIDKTDLNDNTLLVFESRHVVECCQIIYGALNILNNVGILKCNYEHFINEIIEALLSSPLFYSDAIEALLDIAMYNVSISATNENGSIIYKKFAYIMRNIWFVPYGQIDEIANEAIEEFKKHCEEGESNE